jgi:predicted amidohydrolase
MSCTNHKSRTIRIAAVQMGSREGAIEANLERMRNNLRDVAPYYARLLGIPAVSVNKCGPAQAPKSEGYIFPGLASIVESDGVIQAQMEGQEGFITAEVTLDSSRMIHAKPRAYDRYIYPGPPGRVLFVAVESVGRLWYTFSRNRRKSAQAALTTSTGQHEKTTHLLEVFQEEP